MGQSRATWESNRIPELIATPVRPATVARDAAGFHDLRFGCAHAGKGHILADGPIEEERVLQDDAKVRAVGIEAVRADPQREADPPQKLNWSMLDLLNTVGGPSSTSPLAPTSFWPRSPASNLSPWAPVILPEESATAA